MSIVSGSDFNSSGVRPWHAAEYNWEAVCFSHRVHIQFVCGRVFYILAPVRVWVETGFLWLGGCVVFCVTTRSPSTAMPAVMPLKKFCHIQSPFQLSSVWLVLSWLPIPSYRYAHTAPTRKQAGVCVCVCVCARAEKPSWMCWQHLCECVIVIRLGSNKSVDSGKTELVCRLQRAHLSTDLKRCLNWGEAMSRAEERPLRDHVFKPLAFCLGFLSTASWFLLVARSIVN